MQPCDVRGLKESSVVTIVGLAYDPQNAVKLKLLALKSSFYCEAGGSARYRRSREVHSNDFKEVRIIVSVNSVELAFLFQQFEASVALKRAEEEVLVDSAWSEDGLVHGGLSVRRPDEKEVRVILAADDSEE